MKYLIENGHRKIGFLTDNRVGVDRARFWGYRRALKEAGIEYSDRDFFLFKPTKESVDRNIEKLCRKARNYTALFCCSDIYAVIIMAALKDRGFRIPDLTTTSIQESARPDSLRSIRTPLRKEKSPRRS